MLADLSSSLPELSFRTNPVRCDCRIRCLTSDTPTLHFHLKGGERIGRPAGFWVVRLLGCSVKQGPLVFIMRSGPPRTIRPSAASAAAANAPFERLQRRKRRLIFAASYLPSLSGFSLALREKYPRFSPRRTLGQTAFNSWI